MTQILTLRLPAGSSAEDAKALRNEIVRISAVESAGVQQTRGLDAATIAIWLSVAKPVADLSMTLVRDLVDVIRGKLRGVVIDLPDNGGTLKVDEASAADLAKLLEAMRTA